MTPMEQGEAFQRRIREHYRANPHVRKGMERIGFLFKGAHVEEAEDENEVHGTDPTSVKLPMHMVNLRGVELTSEILAHLKILDRYSKVGDKDPALVGKCSMVRTMIDAGVDKRNYMRFLIPVYKALSKPDRDSVRELRSNNAYQN